MTLPRRLRVSLLLVFGLVGLAGLALQHWSQRPQEAALRIGIAPWIGYEPFVAAREADRWPQGVVLVELGSGTEAIDAFTEGRIDLIGLTVDECLQLKARGWAHDVVTVLSDSRGGDALLGRAGLASTSGLAGRTVLLEDTAVAELVLDTALASAGLPEEAVTRRRVTAARLLTAWQAGGADAVVAYSPVIEQLEAGGATVLFSTHDHPGLVMDLLAARPGLGRDPRVGALLKAWDDGVAELAREEPAALEGLARGFGLDIATYRLALSKVAFLRSHQGRALLQGSPPPILATLRRIDPLVRADDDEVPSSADGAAP